MKKVSLNYPYPVLNDSNEDFIDCSFNISLGEASNIDDSFILPFSYTLTCPSIEKRIQSGKAKVVLYIESSETQYRTTKSFEATEKTINVTIEKSLLGNEIRVKGFVVSLEDIFPYMPEERNIELFGDVPFRVGKNEYLAISNDKYTIPVETYDPLADRPSIFSIRKSNSDEEIEIDYSQNKITIYINEELHALYKKYYEAPENRVILASFFATPALEDVLSMMKMSSPDDLEVEYGKLKWYQVIKSKLTEKKIDIFKEDSLVKIANTLLPHVFRSNVEEFGNMYDQYNSGGDLS
ncbi:MAG: hypothetical protein IJI66_13635 [Erysipelotrichaceae bacterium]|nr:hypothetical protein [Erysipelotrichaceae bacterium]